MELFASKKQIWLFFCIAILILCVNIGYEFYKFLAFKEKNFKFIEARVELSYPKTNKQNRTYFVAKLKSEDFTIYTTTKEEIRTNAVRIGIVTKKISFTSYLQRRFYAPSFKPTPIYAPPTLSGLLSSAVKSQHESPKLGELYSALYLATPIGKELRQDVVNWGIGHLVAISGYHLGLIFAILFFIFRLLTKPFYERYPYKNSTLEISLVIFAFLTFYLVLLDFTPSFLRSYLMSIFAFLLLTRGLRIFEVGNLLCTAAVAVAFMPQLVFSIGFYLSCLGVYFILLYARYFGKKEDLKRPWRIAAHILGFEVFIYSAMNVPVFYFFHSASLFQLFVIPLSYLFAFFYPLSIALHLVGCGGLFDEFLLRVIPLASEQGQIHISLSQFVLFNLLLVAAYRYKLVGLGLAAWGLGVFFLNLL